MSPPSETYKAPEYMSTIAPPIHLYEKPIHDSFSTMRPPSQSYDVGIHGHLSQMKGPKDNYLPPKPVSMTRYTPPTGDFSALQPNYRHKTAMKPPAESYKRPPIVQKDQYLEPPKDNYLPPPTPSLKPHYKPPSDSYSEGMKTIMAKLSLPEQNFLEHAMSGTKGYLPPQEDYKAPSLEEHHVPPTTDYIETMFKYLKDMNAPTKDYLPPDEAHFQPPQESYDAPINDYLSSMHLPRKGYLPPDEPPKDKPPGYAPPNKTYKDAMAEYLGGFHAPESAYLPPAKPKGVYMTPPASNYENPHKDHMTKLQPPASSYENPHEAHMSKLRPPASSYENPHEAHMSQLHPPDKGYLPPKELTSLLPELASYLSPISEYMASMLPPQTDYSYKEKFKPPTNDYIPPHGQGGSKLKPPSREYLKPFRPSASTPRRLPLFPPTRQQQQPRLRPAASFFTTTACPPADKNVKCEYVKNQCWSRGTPDIDCPGEGLCCFNGCNNVCLRPSSPYLTKHFHVSPHQAYLVPGKQNLYLQQTGPPPGYNQPSQDHALPSPPHPHEIPLNDLPTLIPPNKAFQRSSKRRIEEGDVDTHFLPPPYNMYSLAPALETIEISGLPERPNVSELPPRDKANMVPPAKEYLPPPGYQLPDDGYDLPTYEGAELSDIQKYLPPTAEYQQAGVAGLHIPTEDYLPPTKITHYSPPALGYKLPKSIELLVPPANEYLPPDKMTKYKPPSGAYEAPGTITKYHPPTADYISPKERLRPPIADYLAPLPTVTTTLTPHHFSHGSIGATFRPPSEDYLVPGKENLYLQETGVPFRPPSQEYIPPGLAVSDPYHQPEHHDPGVPLTLPYKDYIPPTLAVSDPYNEAKKVGAPLVPPDQQYIAPGTKNYNEAKQIGAPLVPPDQQYLAPGTKAPHHASFSPPVKGYEKPIVVGAIHDSKDYSPLLPPVKEYLPPGHPNYSEPTLVPHLAEHGVFHPPTKEYLPPKTLVSPEGTKFQPPASDYSAPASLPPHGTVPHHDDGGYNIDMTYKPPSREYLPPPGYNQPSKDHALPTPPHPHEIPHNDLPTLIPPNKEYLPPPHNTIEEIGHAIHLSEHHEHHVTDVPPPAHHQGHVTVVPPVLLPKPDGKDYHITATINKDGHIEPHHGIVSKVGPHSINIHITVPEKDQHIEHHPPHPPTGTLFRTSKPPKHPYTVVDSKPVEGHDGHDVKVVVKDDYHEVKPHMLPHEHHVGYENDGPHHDHHVEGDVHVMMPHMLPHDHHKGYSSGPPPSLPQYVPPPLSTTYKDGHYKQPKYLQLPPKQYQPSYHRLPAKEYIPTNPQIYEAGYPRPSYESKSPEKETADLINPMQTFKPPVANFQRPSQLSAPIKANNGYIVPEKATLRPPDKDYLPPPGRLSENDYLPPGDREQLDPSLPIPPDPQELPEEIDDGFTDLSLDYDADLPSRGPQFRPLQQKEMEYSQTPIRSGGLGGSLDIVIEDILNSQANPPSEGKEMYIPPKTKFDVPKNFIRPDDLLRAPSPPGFDSDYDDVDQFGTIDVLDAENLPEPPLPEVVPEQLTEQPFLGLAKLIDPDRKKSLKELEELRAEVKKLAKLVEKPKGPQLPPIPTVPSLLSISQQLNQLPPQPSSFVPFLEKLEPTVLQQLRNGVRSQNTRDNKIPGRPGVDYPDFKTIPATDFSCENFLLEGFYADTFTSCQVSLASC